MMYSVTDVSGINRISEKVLSNAAHALAGMIAYARTSASESKPAIGLTMFGVTTPCVQAVTKQLQNEFDCLVFHATGTGGQSMEKLVDSGLLAGVLDISTTEVCDEIVGGVLSAGPGAIRCLCATPDSVRRLMRRARHGELLGVRHRAAEVQGSQSGQAQRECHLDAHHPRRMQSDRRIHRRQAESDGRSGALHHSGRRRVVLDAPGKTFWDPVADKALFTAIESNFRRGPRRMLIRSPLNLNDPAFADLLVQQFHEVCAEGAALTRTAVH